MFPSSSTWTWEALPHGTDAFLIGFPSLEDLQWMDGMQFRVPNYEAQASISIWKKKYFSSMRVLEQVWAHVQGVLT